MKRYNLMVPEDLWDELTALSAGRPVVDLIRLALRVIVKVRRGEYRLVRSDGAEVVVDDV